MLRPVLSAFTRHGGLVYEWARQGASMRFGRDLEVTMPAGWKAAQAKRTVDDFGAQWTRFPGNEGRYGGEDYFWDIVGDLLTPDEVRGAAVADIGSGSGRIVSMLLAAGARRVVAVEPSAAFEVLVRNTADRAADIEYQNRTGDAFEAAGLDLVVSLGVLHHIPDPGPTVRRCRDALRPGGKMVVWLYASEGNGAYLALVRPLRAITTRLPDRMLAGMSAVLELPLSAYVGACRWLPLPMRRYARDVLATLDRRARALIIFDQLNPAYAKYYSRAQARALLEDQGFTDVRLWHRHGYSWTVSGRRPLAGGAGSD